MSTRAVGLVEDVIKNVGAFRTIVHIACHIEKVFDPEFRAFADDLKNLMRAYNYNKVVEIVERDYK